ncbi:hypothetical protein CPLU01_08303 [Colletotrichum plurivorum]|uniref:Uncharacterized protein n=1 Tax=Colletotrichum plurivorum TaxID=2175906 RepID=A0A8H6NCR3_9PEZI|nr:hypothetical protein CPLU01_08303 [Colletotrichum plurivorum]
MIARTAAWHSDFTFPSQKTGRDDKTIRMMPFQLRCIGREIHEMAIGLSGSAAPVIRISKKQPINRETKALTALPMGNTRRERPFQQSFCPEVANVSLFPRKPNQRIPIQDDQERTVQDFEQIEQRKGAPEVQLTTHVAMFAEDDTPQPGVS